MTLEYLRKNNLIVLECISGSKAYGLDTPTSDTDIRGVFILPKEKFYGLEYVAQVSDANNDIVFYELRKCFELLLKNNPTIIELLNTPEDKIIFQHPLFKQIDRTKILSKLCKNTFANYAIGQIKKARGLNKKIVNPIAKEKKNILHFCYVSNGLGSMDFLKWLEKNNFQQENCGLTKINHMRDLYSLFYDESASKGFKGVMRKETANEVLLSSIPKGTEPLTQLSFNQDGYTKYCKDYKEYWSWVESRNHDRYENTVEHGKNYDAKNMMHTFRLLKMALEILQDGKVNVRRNDREELLAIKRGEREYEDLLQEANQMIEAIDVAYENCSLPETLDEVMIERLLFEIRDKWYQEHC